MESERISVKVNWEIFTIPPALFSFLYMIFITLMVGANNAKDFDGKTAFVVYVFSSIITFLFIWAFHVIIKNINVTNEAVKAKDEAVEAKNEVKSLSVEVMEALAHTIDAKDEYTRGHSVRVAKYSRMLAEKLGLSAEDCENVYYMALLHDIGKIGVPNAIINSPTRLTDEEFGVIKTHPGVGYDILAEIKSRPDLSTGARWHHERYDGKGYPDGKAGEDIPFFARIIAVADSYDAMTSYAERLRMVRKLSAPSLEEVESADDYSRLLLHNFRKIGELAGENAEVCAGLGLDEEVYREAYEAFRKCERMMAQPGGEELADKYGSGFLKMAGLRAAILCADPSATQLLSEVVESYEKRDVSDYSYGGNNDNLATPGQILFAVDALRKRNGGILSEKLLELQRQIPYEVMLYYSNARLGDMAIPFVNHLTNFLEDFREVPGGIRCSELCMRSLAAIHPPTYIHSNMVAKFTLCLTRHLLCRHPELFVNFPGCGSVEAVTAANDQILDYAYQAALYHDIGKLTIIDIIAMYGRRLLDTEFLELKKHPDNGAELAARFDSLMDYADVMRGHHLWYDGSRGYPLNFKAAESPYKTIIDIVTVADCMDAATDRVGRSYSKGKTIEEFTKEIEEGAGTHYAPFMAELLAEPAVEEDIRYLLDEGRSKLYRDTFNLLVDLLHKGKSGQN